MKIICRLLFILSSSLFAQTATLDRALGTVTSVDLGGRRIALKTDAGTNVVVSGPPTTSFRRIAPGESDLQKAAMIALADISVGDRVLARGKAGVNGNEVAATLVVVMSQGDIAHKQAVERVDWNRRGVVGHVTMTEVDQIVIDVRTAAGITPVAITLAPNATVRRYAPDSVRFADARPAKLAETKTGDQVRARGNRTGDGNKMTAEEVVFGTFRTIAGVILSLDPQQNEVRINDLGTKRPLVVKINADSSLRKLQPQVAQSIALRVRENAGPPAGRPGSPPQAGGTRGSGGSGAGPTVTTYPPSHASAVTLRGNDLDALADDPEDLQADLQALASAGPSGGSIFIDGFSSGQIPQKESLREIRIDQNSRSYEYDRIGFGRIAASAGDLQQMIEGSLSVALAELNVGDAIVVSSTVGASAERVTAITLLGGVEPILRRPGTQEMSLGTWTLEIGDP